ncbi:MAG: condensation domain-containing protein [Candidatus Thorarchaeota archaeon]
MSTTNDSKPYRREVAGEERRILLPPTMHISLGLRLLGQISEEALRTAVDKMLITYPLFGARFEWSDEGVHWSTTEGAAEVPVKTYNRESDESWIQVLNDEHAIPISLSKGPLTRFILVKGEDVSELIVFCHHAISDGRSLEYALREVLLHLKDPNREPPMIPVAPPQTPEILPEGISMGKLRSVMINKINQKWEEEKTVFDEEDLHNLWEAFWKNSEYRIETLEFDEDATQKLIEAARLNDVTLNSLLVVTLAKARIDTVGRYDGKAVLGSAVDSRKKLRVDCTDAVGYYAGSSLIQFKYKEKSSLWDNVRRYHKEISKHLKDNKIFEGTLSYSILDPTLIDAILFLIVGDQVEPHQSRYAKISEFASHKDGLVAKQLERSAETAPDVLSTNLGVLALPEDNPRIQIERAFFTPSSSFVMELVLGVATAGGKLTITLNYYKGYVNGENIRKIRDRSEEMLSDLIE